MLSGRRVRRHLNTLVTAHFLAPNSSVEALYGAAMGRPSLGPMSPKERRLLFRVGIPGLLLFLCGGGLAIAGDQTGTTALMAVGFPMVGVGFVVWGAVVYRLTNRANPALKAWNKSVAEGPAANKFNTVICSLMLVGGAFAAVQRPHPFWLAWFGIGAVMLLVFVRRGWFTTPK
jgi:hypothetical protein